MPKSCFNLFYGKTRRLEKDYGEGRSAYTHRSLEAGGWACRAHPHCKHWGLSVGEGRQGESMGENFYLFSVGENERGKVSRFRIG